MGFNIGNLVGGIVNAGRNVVEAGRNVVENVVEKSQEVVGNVVDTTQDVFEAASEKVNQVAAPVVDFLAGSKDKVNDGKQVYADGTTRPAGTPIERDPSQPLVLHVNGIMTDLPGQQQALDAIAGQVPNAQVVGIHNATQGLLGDLGQAALDIFNKGSNPAVDSLADTMYAELEAGRPVHVMAHSQGGLVTSRAVEQVRQRLMMEGGLTPEQATARLNDVHIESFASAAPSWPDGPQYVHYINRADPVPGLVGLGAGPTEKGHPGEGAQIHYFTDLGGGTGFHNFNDTYLEQRVPFEQARAGDFSQTNDNRL